MSATACVTCKYGLFEDPEEQSGLCQYPGELPRCSKAHTYIRRADGTRPHDEDCPLWAAKPEDRALRSALGTAEAAKARRKG